MHGRWLLALLTLGLVLAGPTQFLAPLDPYRQAQAAPNQRQAPRNPQLDTEDQLTPGQIERAQEREREPDRSGTAPAAKTGRRSARQNHPVSSPAVELSPGIRTTPSWLRPSSPTTWPLPM